MQDFPTTTCCPSTWNFVSPTGWGCREGQSCDTLVSWANGASPLPAGQNPELQPTSVDPMFVKFLAIFCFFGFFKINLLIYIYFWLCWVFASVRGLSLVAASGGHSSSRCAGLSLSRPLLLRSTGSRRAGSVVVAHGPSCSTACGIFPDQGSNPCPLHWQADSQPLRHQGSPLSVLITAQQKKKRDYQRSPRFSQTRSDFLLYPL